MNGDRAHSAMRLNPNRMRRHSAAWPQIAANLEEQLREAFAQAYAGPMHVLPSSMSPTFTPRHALRSRRRLKRMRERPRRVGERAALSLSIAETRRRLAEGDLTINQARTAMGLKALGPVGDTTARRRPNDLPGALEHFGLATPEPLPPIDTESDLRPYDLSDIRLDRLPGFAPPWPLYKPLRTAAPDCPAGETAGERFTRILRWAGWDPVGAPSLHVAPEAQIPARWAEAPDFADAHYNPRILAPERVDGGVHVVPPVLGLFAEMDRRRRRRRIALEIGTWIAALGCIALIVLTRNHL